ncbi:MAG: glutamate--tRNA ligase [Candidatus Gastranaerophilales bacterium]|nr:glutamate--tRNA ligase [Candidatus Gastranaerophilales bacterium]
MSDIRVRIAPSPSGNLHVGTARTALFNFLFAKKNNGKFVLRIEDTDLERSSVEYIRNIFDSLKAMGLNWDEGPDVGGDYAPYTQSEKFDTYKQFAQKLVDEGFAYECYCTQEELEEEKQTAINEKKAYIYSNRCRALTPEQKAQFIKEGRKPVVRFKMPAKLMKFKDLVKGDLEFNTALTGDFVIMKSNGTPTYNFAVVIDDMQMAISHIIRGEDHISNTPKQIAIYEALGAKIPEFAHVGMILAPDRTKLSKRHGATAVSEFIEQGYLPEAFVNFIALLGWTPSDGVEIKTLDEIIKDFDLSGISPSNSIFEFDKLNWMNGQYIRSMPNSEITKRALKYMQQYDLSEYSQEQLEEIVAAVKEPVTVLSEITDSVEYFFGDDVNCQIEALDVLKTDDAKAVLNRAEEFVNSLDLNNHEQIVERLGEFRKSFEAVKPKTVMWTLRAALTGRLKGADLSHVIEILGKEKISKRINKAKTL